MVSPPPVLANTASFALTQVLPRPLLYMLAVVGAWLAIRPLLRRGARRRLLG